MNHQLDQDVVAGFISEAKGYLPEIILGLETLAAAPEQRECLQEAFRYVHIIKGAASMLGFNEIGELAYQLEVRLEMLSEKEVSLTQEMLEDLCQNVSDIAELLDTSLLAIPSLTQLTGDQTEITDAYESSSTHTGFDFFFTSQPATDEAGREKAPGLDGNILAQTPPALTEGEEDVAPPSLLQETNFSVSLPDATDTTTVGDLNLNNIAAALKESFGNVPPPPQPEFPLPSELMSPLPGFQFDSTPSATDEISLLEVPESIGSELSYQNLSDSLADDLLAASPASRALPAPEATPVQEAPVAEAPPEPLELLPLPALPELVGSETPAPDTFTPQAVAESSAATNDEAPICADDEFPPATSIVETASQAVNNDALHLSELPEELLETFLLEAEEHLQIMQTALRTLEKTPDDIEALQEIRRSAHSLKGTAALIGFRNIMQLAHRMEDLLDLVYDETITLTPASTQLLMRATDALEDMSNGHIDEATLQQLYAQFAAVLLASESPSEILEAASDLPPEIAQALAEAEVPPEPEATFSLASEPAAPVETETWSFSESDATSAFEFEFATETEQEAPPIYETEPCAVTEPEPLVAPLAISEAELATAPEEEVVESETSLPDRAEETTQEEAAVEMLASEPLPSLPELPPIVEEEPAISNEVPSETPASDEVVAEMAVTLDAPVAVPAATLPNEAEVPLLPRPTQVVSATPQTTAQTSALPSVSNQFLRVPIERMDEVVKLIGEMIIMRTAFEQRLTDFARHLEELQIAGARLRHASSTLESKYEASALGGGRIASVPGKLAAGVAANGSVNSLVTHHTHGFDDLEFDRYTEFHLLSRELTEASSDIQTVGREFTHLNTDFLSYLNRQGRIYNELQDRLIRLRMVPLTSIAPRLHRAVRQVSTQENKLVELILEGETTAIDTTALQELIDPLLHLLRNAVDHGIELPETRLAKGKSATGTIRLRAFYEGSQVVLQLSDDGKGLELEKIRNKAIQHGLISVAEAESMSKAELWSLIFTPGFSTAERVSEISGRGVGMDIVQTAVQKLKGTITIASEPDAGVHFTIRLPLTLAVTRAVMVKAHAQSFAIPLDVVTQILRLDMNKVERIGKEPVIRVGGKIYPLLMLSRLLNLRQISDEVETRPPALLINVEGREVAVIVDQLIGGREIVVKTLGNHLRKVHGVMGATLMGNGEVVLILSLAELVRGTTHSVVRRTAVLPLNAPAPAVDCGMQNAESEIEDSSIQNPKPEIQNPLPPPKADKAPLTIMVVDDSPSVRRVNSNLIKNLGWVPVQAKDGLEAFEKLQASEAKPDLIMLDIEMPRMDGYQLLSSLRALPAFRHLPIVMVSSRSSEKHRQKAFDLGATEYLVKPYQEDHVEALIRRLVQADEASV